MKGKRHSDITIIFLVEIICNAWLSRVRVQCLMSFFLLSNGRRSSRIFGEFKDTSNYLITTLNFVRARSRSEELERSSVLLLPLLRHLSHFYNINAIIFVTSRIKY